jgi:YD repeat-containing protein
VRGNITKYEYSVQNRITKITDAQGRAEQLAYTGDAVNKYTAPDGAVTDYLFEFDDTNEQFISKISGPETPAGRKVEDITHNRAGKLVRQIVNGRTEREARYDTGARVEYRTNARGFTTRITRNEFDLGVRIDSPDGSSRQRAYSAQHLQVTEEVDCCNALKRLAHPRSA